MNKKRIAKFLMFATLFTILWIFICPKHVLSGETESRHSKIVRDESRKSKSGNGPWVYGKKRITTDYFQHPDPIYFGAGILIIYGFLTSLYLWTDD